MAGASGRRDRVDYAVAAFVVTAAAPRVAHRARWPTRAGRWGVAASIACNTVVGFALRTWALPWLRRVAAQRDELARSLGRAPSEQELRDHLRMNPVR